MTNKYTWATEDIFESNAKWEEEFKNLSSKISFSEFRGKLSNEESILRDLYLKKFLKNFLISF